jgi:hypothetical protein
LLLFQSLFDPAHVVSYAFFFSALGCCTTEFWFIEPGDAKLGQKLKGERKNSYPEMEITGVKD